MEAYIKKIMMTGISLLIAMLFIPFSALAYDDTGELRAHGAINKNAISYFEQYRIPDDKYLKSSAASLEGQAVYGYAWDRDGPERAILATSERPDIRKTGRMKAWIIGGGFSADEPEGSTALVHFYDPMAGEGNKHLTDQQMVTNILGLKSTLNQNPGVDARKWAIEDVSLDMDIYLYNFIQEYSFEDAKKNLIEALKSTDIADSKTSKNYYGKAWRGIGETMHMMADMTVPAHVRNDGHAVALGDADPYECSTNETHVNDYAFYSPASLNYKTDLKTLMDTVATFTNNNFFSKDTIPGQTNSITQYDLPSKEGMTKDKDGFLINSDDAPELIRGTVAAAPNPYIQKIIDKNKGPYTTYNPRVLTAQRVVLIPTAIRACAAVIDRFLPRFIASQSISPADPKNPNNGKYLMHGTIKLAKDAWNHAEWPGELVVNNGAMIVLTGSDGKVTTTIRIDPKKLVNGMNEFSYGFDAKPTDKVELVYDLGGYLVSAVKNEVITTEITDITQTTATGGGNVFFDGAVMRGVCWSASPDPTFTDSHTTNGSGTGVFLSNLTDLTPNATYYVRAYAIDSEGTYIYGNQVSFTTTTSTSDWEMRIELYYDGESELCEPNVRYWIPVVISSTGNVTFDHSFTNSTGQVYHFNGSGTYLPDPKNYNSPTLNISGSWTMSYTRGDYFTQNGSGTFTGSGYHYNSDWWYTSLTANYSASSWDEYAGSNSCTCTLKNSLTYIVDFRMK